MAWEAVPLIKAAFIGEEHCPCPTIVHVPLICSSSANSISCLTHSLAGTSHPETGLAGKFSLPFCTAAAIVTGHITIQTFSEDVLNHPQVQRLLNIIELVPNDSYTPSRGGRATFYMKNGEIYTHEIYLLGKDVEPKNLKKDVYEKYMEIAPEIIGNRAEAVWNMLQNLEKIEDLQTL